MMLLSKDNRDSRKEKNALNTVNMPMQLSFCKMYNKNSDQLLNLFFDDKGKHTQVINYFTETVQIYNGRFSVHFTFN